MYTPNKSNLSARYLYQTPRKNILIILYNICFGIEFAIVILSTSEIANLDKGFVHRSIEDDSLATALLDLHTL